MPFQVTPPDEGEGGILPMLLFTIHGPDIYADGNDNTYGESNLLQQEGYTQIVTPLDPKVTIPDDIEISHVIIYARAGLFAQDTFDYTQFAILYGNNKTAISPWPLNRFGQQVSGNLVADPDGNPWTVPAIFALTVGCECYWNGLSFIAGTILMSEVYVEVYGRPGPARRRRKFFGGDYSLTIRNQTRIATLTVDEIRQVYEAATGRTYNGKSIPLLLTALRLDNGGIRSRVYKVNSTFATLMSAIEEAKQPPIG